MKLSTVKLYPFSQLDENIQNTLREEGRDALSLLWSGNDLEAAFEDVHANLYGAEDFELLYDLSYCQGAGASYTCSYDLLKLLNQLWKYSSSFDEIKRLVESELITVEVNITRNELSRYVHENTISVDLEVDEYDYELSEEQNELLEELEKEIDRFAKEESRRMYRELQDSYEDIMSDDTVEESLSANGECYLENGTFISEDLQE